MIRVDFMPFADTGSIASVATLEEAKKAVGFRYPNAAFALSWCSHYLPNPDWHRATLDVWRSAEEQAGDYLQKRVVAKLVNESNEAPGPDEKLDCSQLPSEVPKEPNPRNLIERDGILMMIVPVIAESAWPKGLAEGFPEGFHGRRVQGFHAAAHAVSRLVYHLPPGLEPKNGS